MVEHVCTYIYRHTHASVYSICSVCTHIYKFSVGVSKHRGHRLVSLQKIKLHIHQVLKCGGACMLLLVAGGDFCYDVLCCATVYYGCGCSGCSCAIIVSLIAGFANTILAKVSFIVQSRCVYESFYTNCAQKQHLALWCAKTTFTHCVQKQNLHLWVCMFACSCMDASMCIMCVHVCFLFPQAVMCVHTQ